MFPILFFLLFFFFNWGYFFLFLAIFIIIILYSHCFLPFFFLPLSVYFTNTLPVQTIDRTWITPSHTNQTWTYRGFIF